MTRKWKPWERDKNWPRAITRKQWRLSQSPGQMLDHLEAVRKASDTRSGERKLLLFHVACCRRAWKLLERDPVRPVLEAAERYADGDFNRGELVRLVDRVGAEVHDSLPDVVYVSEESVHALLQCGGLPRRIDHLRVAILTFANPMLISPFSDYLAIAHGVAGRNLGDELSGQCALLRDIFGDPFRQVAFSPAWRTDTAVLLAKQMYESRDFGAMPILADALQDADCNDDTILSHCRDPKQVHVRGCWVVDAVLGMSRPKRETTERSPS